MCLFFFLLLSLYLSLSFPPSLSTILSLVSSMSSLLHTFLLLSFAFYLSFSSSSMSLSQMSFVSALPASLPLSPFLSFCVSVCLMSPNLLASFPNGWMQHCPTVHSLSVCLGNFKGSRVKGSNYEKFNQNNPPIRIVQEVLEKRWKVVFFVKK